MYQKGKRKIGIFQSKKIACYYFKTVTRTMDFIVIEHLSSV